MDTNKTYVGPTEDQIWSQIATDINDDITEFHAILRQGELDVYLDIDIDLGGGFEGGYATTSYRAPVSATGFEFAIHDEHFVDEIGKFFHMQDIEIGYPDLDRHLIIKTNDKEKARSLFTDEQARNTFAGLENFDLGIRLHSVDDADQKKAFLELNIEDGITEIAMLRKLYHAFYTVLSAV